MKTEDIVLFTNYNKWANHRILGAVTQLSEADFLKDLGSSFGSIRNTLVHIFAGEWIWFNRWKGISPEAMPSPDEFSDLAILRRRWNELEMDQRNFLSKISDESLQEMVEYQNIQGETWEYSLWQMIHQVVSHSTYHRGQVVSMLRQLGADAIPLDFLIYLDMNPVPKELP